MPVSILKYECSNNLNAIFFLHSIEFLCCLIIEIFISKLLTSVLFNYW